MGKYTPGPWNIHLGGYESMGIPIEYAPAHAGGMGKIVATVFDHAYTDWDEEERPASEIWKTTGDEEKANARLIAAAPELLEACEELLSEMFEAGNTDLSQWKSPEIRQTIHNRIKKAQAAIEKARGES